jgi:membrane fusion protein, multidrug efflux system
MSRRNGWIGLVVAAIAVLLAVVAWRGCRPGQGADDEAVVTEVPVHVGTIASATMHRYVASFGTVEPEPPGDGRPAASARVASPIAGLVASVSCEEGQTVKLGALLVRLDTRVVDVQLARAAEAVKFAELVVARQTKLLAVEATSQKALEEARQQLALASSERAAAQAERDLHEVKAPLAGMVVRLAVKRGDAVDPSATLAEIVDLGRLVVSVGVPSAEAVLVKVGQVVELAGTASPVAGRVAFVGVLLDTKTDTVPVRIALAAGHGLKPGRFVDVRIMCEERTGCLVVPEDALVADGLGGNAIAVVEGDKAVMRPVTVGLKEGGRVEVQGDGLKAGVTIVTEGAYGLPKETRIKVVGS